MATAVFFHAHPDDEAIATAGTMALAVEAGHRVLLVLATRGECGEPVEGVLGEGEELGVRREAEARRSAEIIGAHRVEFLGYRDSGMMGEATNDDPSSFWSAEVGSAADRLAAVLDEERADILTVYDGHGGYGHPDHIQVHRVGIEAARRAGVGRVFESTMNRDHIRRTIERAVAEGVAPRGDLEETLDDVTEGRFGTPAADISHEVDVSEMLERKRSAMLAHASQIGSDSFFLELEPDRFAEAFGREWYIERGGSGSGPPFGVDLFADP